MATNPKKADESDKGALVPHDVMPSYLAEVAGADAGRGVSTSAADNIVPMVYVLQPLSPQVDQSSPQRIEGAQPGMIWLRNSPVGVVPGDQGILFQPCHFEKVWPEWVPREKGGGFVARHKNWGATAKDVERFKGRVDLGEDIPDIGDADFKVDPATRMKLWSRPNGNDLRLTRNHAGYVVINENRALPYVLPLTGSGHGVSRSWMYSQMSKRLPDGRILPSWACLYRLTTRQRQNQKGRWYQLEPADAGYVDAAGYARGKELNTAFMTGAMAAEEDSAVGGEGAAPAGSGGGDPGLDDKIPF